MKNQQVMSPAEIGSERWVQQCAAAKRIKERFGLEKALEYLVGKKLFKFVRNSDPTPPVPTKNLAEEYERHTRKQRDLVARARVVRDRMALITAAMKTLLADNQLVSLFARHGLGAMPKPLAERMS
jgi:hypothetical protein